MSDFEIESCYISSRWEEMYIPGRKGKLRYEGIYLGKLRQLEIDKIG